MTTDFQHRPLFDSPHAAALIADLRTPLLAGLAQEGAARAITHEAIRSCRTPLQGNEVSVQMPADYGTQSGVTFVGD